MAGQGFELNRVISTGHETGHKVSRRRHKETFPRCSIQAAPDRDFGSLLEITLESYVADKSSSARSTSNRIRVLVVDDFPAWRAQIRRILRARLKWAIIFEARDGSQAVEKATELRPDIVLLDVGLPRVNGIEAAKTVRQVSPDSKIIFVTLDGSDDMMRAALATGANGYVLKQNAARELIPAVKTALGNPQ